ncbi:immunoglobulin-like domain-containing protein, partial [Paenibacillus sp. GCM10012307]
GKGDVRPQPEAAPELYPTPVPEPGTDPDTTKLPTSPPIPVGTGNHLVVKVSSSKIATPKAGDLAPSVGVINPYTPGSNIPGVDPVVNKYIGIYEVDSNNKVVKFTLIVLGKGDVKPNPIAAPDFNPVPIPVPGSNPGTTKLPTDPPIAVGVGNHLVVKVSGSAIATPNAGDDGPSGSGVINPYKAGDDIPGVDAEVYRYIGLYEVDALGKVVKFHLIELGQGDISSVSTGLQQDRELLAIGYQSGDHQNHVTKTLYLPAKGQSGLTSITWQTSDNAHILNNGRVIRPGVDDGDAYVTLTATIKDDATGAVATKVFVLKVVKMTDEDAVREAAKQLTVDNGITFAQGDTWEAVTLNFLMLGEGLYGTSISWSSADSSTIAITKQNGQTHAAVHRPQSRDKHVVLTATISRGDASVTKTFLMVVNNLSVTKVEGETRQPTARLAEATVNPDGTPNSDQFVIMRTKLSDGTGIDTVIVDPAKLERLTDTFNPSESQEAKRTVELRITQLAGDPADEIAVEIPSSAIAAVADRNGLLVIRTDEGSIRIGTDTLKQLSDQGTDLYFRLVPVKNSTEQAEANKALHDDSRVKQETIGKKLQILGIPRKIETNLTGSETKVTLPLNSALLAAQNPASLRVFVEHSDGTKELLSGDIQYENGTPTGVEIAINRFSRFQVFVTHPAGGNAINGPAPEFSPLATLDKGDKNGATKVIAGTPEKGNKLVVKVSDKPISVPRAGDQAPSGEGVTNPYVSGNDIFGVDTERNRYIGVYEVDENNRIVRFQLLYVTQEKIQKIEGALIDLLLNGVVQKDTAILVDRGADLNAAARIMVDNEAIIGLLANAPKGSVLTVPQVSDASHVDAVVNGELLKRMIQIEGVFRIEGSLGAYTVPAAAIKSSHVASALGNSEDTDNIVVTFSISLAEQADVTHMQAMANHNRMILAGNPVRFSIAAEWNGKLTEIDKFDGYVHREIRIPLDVQTAVTTGVSINKDGSLLHMPTRIEVRDGVRYAIINSLYNGVFALIDKKVAFQDVKGHWAAAAIAEMTARNVVVGTTKDKFEPNRFITRAEFATILVRSLGLKNDASEGESFSDVHKNDWFYDSVSAAVKFKLVYGYSTGEFKPLERISREEALTILARAMEIADLHKELQASEVESLLAAFADWNEVSEWARKGITETVEAGLVQGRATNGLAPKAKITRAEAVTIIERLLRASKLI